MAFQLTEAFVEFSGSTLKFDNAVNRVKSRLATLKPAFEQIQRVSKWMFLTIAAGAAFAVKGAADAEAQDARLRAALAATGNEVDKNFERFSAFANAIKRLTVLDDDAVKGMMAYALNLGVAADEIEGVTKLGIGLGESLFQGDARAGVDAVSKAYNGNFRALERMIPGMKDAATAEEKWNLVRKAGLAGFSQAEARTQTFKGSLAQLWNEVSDVGKAFGAILLPYLRKTVEFLQSVTASIQSLSPEQKNFLVKWVAIAAAFAGFLILGPMIVVNFIGIARAIATVVSILVPIGSIIAKIGLLFITGLFTPIGLVIATLGLLALAFGYLRGDITQTGSRFKEMLATNVEFLDHFLGSFAGFAQGIKTLWHQAIHFILIAWYYVRDGLEASWEGLKWAFSTLWYGFGGVVADWAVRFWSTIKTVALQFKELWSKVIDYVADKFSSNMVATQARKEVDATFKVGQKIGREEINRMITMGLGGGGSVETKQERLTDQFGGRTLTSQDIDKMKKDLMEVRAQMLKDQDKVEQAERAARERQLNADLEAIEKKTKAQRDSINKWSTEGRKTADENLNKNLATIGKRNIDDVTAQSEARKKQLEEDMKALRSMPKLSDNIKAGLAKLKSAIPLATTSEEFEKLQKELEKLKGDAAKVVDGKDAKFGGKQKLKERGTTIQSTSIEETFKNNLQKRLMGEQMIKSQQAQRAREEAERKRQEAIKIKAQKDTAKNTSKMVELLEWNAAVATFA
jgi:hypothetical protein